MGKFIADTTQLLPFIHLLYPAKLLQPIQMIDHGHGGNLLAKKMHESQNKTPTHVVLQTCGPVGKLIQHSSIITRQVGKIHR